MSGLEEELIVISGMFDADWYRTFYSDVATSGLDPLAHYWRIGGKEDRHPSPLFDAGFYLSTYPDVADAGVNPLVHYLKFGLSEGRRSRSLVRNRHCELILGSGFFTQNWYLSSYPEVAVRGIDPLEHFLDCATAELRDPGPLFSSEYYLTLNPEVAAAGFNPLVHYLTEGLKHDLKIRTVDWQRQRKLLLRSGFFDPDWYLKTNVDVASTGENPLDHYLEVGGTEGRSPSLYFNAELYLLENPDVAENGINPLLHYLQFGVAEGRQIQYLPMAVAVP
jgi:hypothetical protein